MGGAKQAWMEEQDEQARMAFLQELIDGSYITETSQIRLVQKVVSGERLSTREQVRFEKEIEPYRRCSECQRVNFGPNCARCKRDNEAALAELEEMQRVEAVAATWYGALRGQPVGDWIHLREGQGEYMAKAHKLIKNGLSASAQDDERAAWNVAVVLGLVEKPKE